MTKRCDWVPSNDPLYVAYHDIEWGVPVYDDDKLFEFLILEGFQAGSKLAYDSVQAREFSPGIRPVRSAQDRCV